MQFRMLLAACAVVLAGFGQTQSHAGSTHYFEFTSLVNNDSGAPDFSAPIATALVENFGDPIVKATFSTTEHFGSEVGSGGFIATWAMGFGGTISDLKVVDTEKEGAFADATLTFGPGTVDVTGPQTYDFGVEFARKGGKDDTIRFTDGDRLTLYLKPTYYTTESFALSAASDDDLDVNEPTVVLSTALKVQGVGAKDAQSFTVQGDPVVPVPAPSAAAAGLLALGLTLVRRQVRHATD